MGPPTSWPVRFPSPAHAPQQPGWNMVPTKQYLKVKNHSTCVQNRNTTQNIAITGYLMSCIWKCYQIWKLNEFYHHIACENIDIHTSLHGKSPALPKSQHPCLSSSFCWALLETHTICMHEYVMCRCMCVFRFPSFLGNVRYCKFLPIHVPCHRWLENTCETPCSYT